MFNIHTAYEPEAIKDEIGWADHPTISDLVEAIMVLCDVVKRQDRRIAELESADEERRAAEELAESVALYKDVPSA